MQTLTKLRKTKNNMWLCFFIGHKFFTPEKTFGIFPATPYCERCGRYVGGRGKHIEIKDNENHDDENRTTVD